MPQLEQIWSFPSQLFWLLVTFGLLYLLCSRVLLPRIERVLTERQGRIEADINRAKELTEKAEATLAEYEEAVAKANADAQAHIRQSSAEAAEKVQAAQNELSARLNKEAEQATQRIDAARKDAMANIWPVVSETAQGAAGRLMGKKLTAKDVSSVVGNLQKGAN